MTSWITRLCAVVAVALIVALATLASGHMGTARAQGLPAPEAAPAAEPAPDAEPAVAEAPAPALPAALTDPDIPPNELALRLIPLTAGELAALADDWLGIVKAKTEQVVDQQLANTAAGGDVAPEATDRLNALAKERGLLFDKFTAVINSLEKKGGAADAVAGYRAYRNAIVVEETQAADWRTLFGRSAGWLTDRDGGIQFAIDVAVVVGAFAALLIIARVVRRFAARWIERVPNLSKLLQAFLVIVIYWVTIAFGLMIVLSALGVDVTPFFALVGGASFIMAFALQDTLGNLAAGLMIMINRPFDEGDYVDIGGVAGTVKSVSIVSTVVTTPDNQVIVVPNSKVWGNVITNVTASATRRVDLVFGIGYDDSIEVAQQVLQATVAAHPLVLPEPEPVIRVNALGASSVDFICRPWVRSVDYWTVYWDLTRQVKENFDKAGVSIPFPQTDMHIFMSGEKAPDAAPFVAAGGGTASKPIGDTPAARQAAGDGDDEDT